MYICAYVDGRIDAGTAHKCTWSSHLERHEDAEIPRWYVVNAIRDECLLSVLMLIDARAGEVFLRVDIFYSNDLQYHCIKFAVARRYSTVDCIINVMFDSG